MLLINSGTVQRPQFQIEKIILLMSSNVEKNNIQIIFDNGVYFFIIEISRRVSSVHDFFCDPILIAIDLGRNTSKIWISRNAILKTIITQLKKEVRFLIIALIYSIIRNELFHKTIVNNGA